VLFFWPLGGGSRSSLGSALLFYWGQKMKSVLSMGRWGTLAACLVVCSAIVIEGCGKAKDGPSEVDRAIELAKKEASANRFYAAQDAILVAARLEPTNPKVLAAALQLVTELADHSEADGLDVANDLFVQVSSLIPYQSVDAVSEARSKYEKAGEMLAEKLTSSSKTPSESSPLQEFTKLLDASKSPETPTSNRLELLRVARAQLDSLAISLVASPEQAVGISQEQLEEESKRLAAAETAALTSLYSESLQTELQSWRDVDSKNLVDSARAVSKDPAELLKKIKDSVTKGYRLLADAAPYVEAGITSAIEDGLGPIIVDLQCHALGLDCQPQLPMTVVAFQGGMHSLADEQGGTDRACDPVDVPQLKRQRALEPQVQAAGTDVVPDAAGALGSLLSGEQFRTHAAAPLSAASRSIRPALMSLRTSIKPLASRLAKSANGLSNIRCAKVSSRRTPTPRIWPANCRA